MLNTTQIGFNKESKEFFEEMSTLEANGNVMEESTICGRLIGLKMKDGNIVYFQRTKTFTTKDEDAEITHWLYAPTNFSMNNYPRVCGYILKVFND